MPEPYNAKGQTGGFPVEAAKDFSDPLLQEFLKQLLAYQAWELKRKGEKPKVPLPSEFSGGDVGARAKMQALSDKILNKPYGDPGPIPYVGPESDPEVSEKDKSQYMNLR